MAQSDMDNYPDITIAVLALIADMWDNREYTATTDKVNPVVNTILGFYPSNLLPTPDDDTYTAPPAAVLPDNFMTEVSA